jgi:hypothetical protein
LKKSLCDFRPRKSAAYVEIRATAGTELLQIPHSSASIKHFPGFRRVGRDGTDFFNRIDPKLPVAAGYNRSEAASLKYRNWMRESGRRGDIVETRKECGAYRGSTA